MPEDRPYTIADIEAMGMPSKEEMMRRMQRRKARAPQRRLDVAVGRPQIAQGGRPRPDLTVGRPQIEPRLDVAVGQPQISPAQQLGRNAANFVTDPTGRPAVQQLMGGTEGRGRMAQRRQQLMEMGVDYADAMAIMALEGSIHPRLAKMLIMASKGYQ